MAAIDCARAILDYVKDVEKAITLVAIAGAESGWRRDAAGDYGASGPYRACQGYCSWGPWQINICWHSGWIGNHIGNHDPCAIAQWLRNYENSTWAASLAWSRVYTLSPHLVRWLGWWN